MVKSNLTEDEIRSVVKNAKTIAVVGLSDKPERTSYQVAQVMKDAGYKIIPVNPTKDEILGEKTVAKLSDIKEHVDIVNVFRRGEFLPEIANEFMEIDADVFFAQLGIISDAAYQILVRNGYPVVMDACIKVIYQQSS